MLDMISKQIHERALEKASKYLVAEAELLSAIIEVDRNKLYEKFAETYLTPYCVKYLKLSDDVAAMFVRVARKSLQVPELEVAVQEGLQISKAKTIASVIDTKNKNQWIKKAQLFSKEKLEREVAAANPSASRPEKAKPTGPNRIRIEFEVTYEEAELLKRARELMSQKGNKNAQIGETGVMALGEWVQREDPVCKAERAEGRRQKNQTNQKELETPDLKQRTVLIQASNKSQGSQGANQIDCLDQSRDQYCSVKLSFLPFYRVDLVDFLLAVGEHSTLLRAV
jgi:hypothetical protein